MKKILFITASLIMFLAFNVNAQQRPQPRGEREVMTAEQMATRSVERLTKELNLNEKQQSDLKTFYTTSFKEMQATREKNKDNREAMREQMQKNREKTEAELKKILTDDQFKKYKKNEEERMKNRPQGGGRPGGYQR